MTESLNINEHIKPLIIKALNSEKGRYRMSAAAAKLQTSKATLNRMIKRFGIGYEYGQGYYIKDKFATTMQKV